MKKRFIAVVMLLSLAGCNTTRKPVAVEKEQDSRKTREVSDTPNAADTETTAGHLSAVLGPEAAGAVAQEPQERHQTGQAAQTPSRETPITYRSTKDGFNVLMPFVPTVMSSDPTDNVHIRAYQSRANDGLTTYRIFFHYFQKKIRGNESIRAYLGSELPDRLAGIDRGRLVKKKLTKFKGFDARRFEYTNTAGDTKFVCEGVVFVVDGDSIALTLVRLKNARLELSFDKFIESFELLPLEPVLSLNDWVDANLGLRFTPPAAMSRANKPTGDKGLLVMFADDIGHTIGILDATAAYQGITLTDIDQKLSQMKDCGDGFYETTISGATVETPTVQLLRCATNADRIYLIQAYAPQQTYYRYKDELKASMKTFSFTR
jgi:hypothetical protein